MFKRAQKSGVNDMLITAEDTKHALLAHTCIHEGYEKLQRFIVHHSEELTINQKIEGLTQLQKVYESLVLEHEKAV